MGLNDKRGWLTDDTTLKAGSIGGDLRLLGWTDVHDERTLGDLLAAERDGDNVLSDLLRVVSTRKRRLVYLLQ